MALLSHINTILAKDTCLGILISMSISAVLPYIQIILSILLIVGILIQRSEAGLGGTFGGSDGFGGAHYERRGAEKTIFRLTIVIGVLFALSAIVALISA